VTNQLILTNKIKNTHGGYVLSLKFIVSNVPRGYGIGSGVKRKGTGCIYQSKKLNIYYFIVVRFSIIMTLDPDYITKAERERRRQTAHKETKVAKTISIPISYWALLDQVKNKLGKKNVNETLMYCIKEIGIEEGLES